MSRRRLFSSFLVLAGIVLLGVAGLHYLLGYRAQSTGRREWEKARTPVVAATPDATATTPDATATAPDATATAPDATATAPDATATPAAPRENPGISASGSPAEAVPSAPAYPYGKPVARLRIPSAEIDCIVFGGDDQATLEKGPGHVPGTEMPGEETSRKNCVITAHRDSHFRRLGWLRKGHRIELETPAGETLYRVVSREIVKPDAVRVLQPTKNPRLTLITCYPFNYIGAAPERLVVVAEPVSRHPS
jgi:sortase A